MELRLQQQSIHRQPVETEIARQSFMWMLMETFAKAHQENVDKKNKLRKLGRS